MSGPRQIGPNGMTAFVPNGDSRQDTAILLIGTAREAGLDDSRHVRATQGGFYISNDLVAVFDADDDVSGNEEPIKATKASTTKKTSGKRAAKKNSTEGE